MKPATLSRRERQIMDIVYREGEVTAAQLVDHLPDPPSYSAVRALLRVLEEKGHLSHRQDGPRYVHRPTVPRETARSSALEHLVTTFFEGSVEGAVTALLDLERDGLSSEAVERIAEAIEQARREGR